MTPVRILLIELNEDGTAGGSHQALLDLVQRLDRHRWTPVVLFYQDNAFVERVRATGAEVYVWESERRGERAVRGPWWIPWRLATQSRAILRRVQFLRAQDIGLVHVNNSPSYTFGDWLPAARIAGVPCVSHVRGELAAATLPARILVPRFDRLIAISAGIEAQVLHAGVPPDRVTRVYDGVDSGALRNRVRLPGAIRGELGVPAGGLLALIVGHLRPWKGQHVVLEAMRMLEPSVRDRLCLAIAGAPDRFAPDYHRRLQDLAATPELAGRVRFLGARQDVPDLMSAADVVIHASTVAEPFGLVVVEAMALERPVVASALGGPGEIVAPGTGWTFDPSRPDELAHCIEAIAANPQMAATIARAGLGRSARFGIDATVRGVEQVYGEVLAARIAPRVAATKRRMPEVLQ